MDVKIKFLYGNLEQKLFIIQLEGFEIKGKDHLIYCLHKELYGL